MPTSRGKKLLEERKFAAKGNSMGAKSVDPRTRGASKPSTLKSSGKILKRTASAGGKVAVGAALLYAAKQKYDSTVASQKAKKKK